MLAVSNCSKSFGAKTILNGVSFTVKKGHRVGLVGPNGCGKSTLIRILAGLSVPDTGSVRYTPSNLQIGYLPQSFELLPETTIEGYIASCQGDLPTLEQNLARLSLKLTQQPDQSQIQAEYDSLLDRIASVAQASVHAPEILAAFELDRFPPSTLVSHLSGGQKTRLALAGVMLAQPEFLLLDEPTNHLDIQMLEWLENWIIASQLTALFISHDRFFLEHVATSILELDSSSHTVKEYMGSYSDYLSEKQAGQNRQWQEYSDQLAQMTRLRSAAAHLRAIAQFHKGGKADTGDKFAKGFFANRGKETVRKARGIEKKLDRLVGEDRVEKPGQTWQMNIELVSHLRSGQDVIRLDNLSVGYPGHILVSGIQQVIRFNQRLAIIGANGTGKTTLLKTISAEIPALSGQVRLGSNVNLGWMSQEQENLDPNSSALEILRKILGQSETQIRSFLSKYLFKGEDVFLPAGLLSFGERARLSLAVLVAQGCNLILLDEPVNHLDIPARVNFERALNGFNGTIIAVVHDRAFIASFANSIWQIQDGQLKVLS